MPGDIPTSARNVPQADRKYSVRKSCATDLFLLVSLQGWPDAISEGSPWNSEFPTRRASTQAAPHAMIIGGMAEGGPDRSCTMAGV